MPGAKILLVEDNVDTRELLHLYLTKEGYSIVVAATAAEALYMAGADRPDIIITDLGLPDLNGIELIKSLRAMLECSKIPIMAFTAFDTAFGEQAIEAGADRVVSKPVDLDVLVGEVRSLLEKPKPSL
jgi:two-component system KDP operon response regulator KdpE